MKYKFIINLNTDNTIRFQHLEKFKRLFHGLIGSFDYALPTSHQDAVRITRSYLRDGVERIVAVGGDGTVNSVANGFFENGKVINPNAALVVARGGSGWDYYRSVTRNHRLKHWTQMVPHHVVRPVDVGLVSFEDPALESRIFVNMASAGMVADVVRMKEHTARLLPSRLRYLSASLYCLFKSRPVEMEIVTDARRIAVNALAVTVSKGAFAGGGMRFGLDVALDDGLFEITVITMSSPLRLAVKFGKIFSGDYAHEKEILKLKAAAVSIRSAMPVPSEFDGEVYGGTNLAMSVLPKALNVCFPG